MPLRSQESNREDLGRPKFACLLAACSPPLPICPVTKGKLCDSVAEVSHQYSIFVFFFLFLFLFLFFTTCPWTGSYKLGQMTIISEQAPIYIVHDMTFFPSSFSLSSPRSSIIFSACFLPATNRLIHTIIQRLFISSQACRPLKMRRPALAKGHMRSASCPPATTDEMGHVSQMAIQATTLTPRGPDHATSTTSDSTTSPQIPISDMKEFVSNTSKATSGLNEEASSLTIASQST
ncbi:hypothetical protein VN97_g11956 [Penicillium thymicola]|uniref:Uncharacterized protein n=1 Tax=Penicillium thymicola TaxID=293382 RepID=A0AAI9T6B8_PENTH|nr:hypothetical protein VN97_g11956 [Penicillium thymicola]